MDLEHRINLIDPSPEKRLYEVYERDALAVALDQFLAECKEATGGEPEDLVRVDYVTLTKVDTNGK